MSFMLGSSLYKDGHGFCQILLATMIGGVHVIVVAQHMSCPLLVYGIHISTHGTDQKLCLHVESC